MLSTVSIKEKSIDSALFLSPPNNWKDVVVAMKPGAHLLLFGSVKDHHTSAIAAEDSGLEIRDTLAYVYSLGENDTSIKLIAMARKPLDGNVAGNVLRWGTGGLNVDGSRVSSNGESLARPFESGGISAAQLNKIPRGTVTGEGLTGRWPANLTHDNSPNVVAMFPDAKAGCGNGNAASGVPGSVTPLRRGNLIPRKDSGSAARFFYSAPCLNDLCSYLIKLVTPPNGYILTDCDTRNMPINYNYVRNHGD